MTKGRKNDFVRTEREVRVKSSNEMNKGKNKFKNENKNVRGKKNTKWSKKRKE